MIQLVKRSISGDADAFLELMEKNSLAMYKVARGILDNDEDAADAIQDTILTCFEKIHTLKNPEYFKTWMIRILINECNKIHRHYKNFSRAEELPEVPGQDMSIEEFEFKEMLGMLDESYRIILVLYYVEGFRIADIASILNMNENTVKTRLVRARVQLKQEYTSAEDNIQKERLQQKKKKNREFTGITEELAENQNGNMRTGSVTAGSITVSARKDEVIMAKKLDFDKEKNNRNDNVIEEIMQADFPLPKQAEDAKNEAFSRIREMAAASGHTENTENMVQRLQEKSTEKSTGSSGKKSTGTAKSHKKFKTVYKTALGLTAAAAVFSTVCITNPAFAENIPLVGNVFKQLGNSMGFYGDYSKYAKQLTDSAEDGELADTDESQEDGGNPQSAQAEDQNTTENNNADKTKDNESYSKTVDGTTVTLSEVYCNEMALYLSMTIHTEDKFPDTFITPDGKPNIKLSENSTVKYDYMDEKSNLFNAYLDGKMLDDNTYAGVLRIPVEDMTVDEAGWTKFYEVRNAFFKEKGIDVDSEDFSFDKLAQVLGMDEYSDEKLPQVGGPAISDYVKDIKVPDRFAMELDLKDIVGTLPDDQDTTPDIPQDLWDEYNQKMAEHGISTDDADYESLTEEQKNLEHQFFTEMWNEYYERYPEANEGDNRYNSWTLKGDWKFNVDVEKNTSDTVEKDVNVVDENGDGCSSPLRNTI